MSWQPVDTAPVNQRVLVYSRHGGRVTIYTLNQYGQWRDEGDNICFAPSHWMPLPPEPARKVAA